MHIFPTQAYVFDPEIPNINILGCSFFQHHKLIIDLSENKIVTSDRATEFQILIGNTKESLNNVSLETDRIIDQLWLTDSLDLQYNNTMPLKSAVYLLENHSHFTDTENDHDGGKDDKDIEGTEEEANTEAFKKTVHLLETCFDITNHPNIEAKDEIVNQGIEEDAKLFGVTQTKKEHIKTELLNSIQMEEKEEVLDDLIDNTELDHAESNVLRQSSFLDWDLVAKPTPKLNSEDVNTGTVSTKSKQSLLEILEKYKKIIPENTSGIGRFSYFRANFGIHKNKTT